MKNENRKAKVEKMQKIKLINALLILVIFSSCTCTRESNNPTIIGHRGAATLAPENTITAIDSSIAHHLSFAEIDVRRTKDSVVIVMHDKSLNRTTNGKGIIKQKNYSYIESINIRHEFNNIGTPIKVPTLDAVLNHIKAKEINLIIELKDPKEYPGIESQVVALIEEYDLQNRIIVASFDQKALQKIRKLNHEIKIGVFTFFPSKIKIENPYFVGIYWPTAYLTPKRIHKMKNENIRVWAWTVDSANRACKLSNKGIDGIITNDPLLYSR